MKVVGLLVVLVLAACEDRQPPVVPMYALDTGNRISAIRKGCYQGELAMCSCTMAEPITCIHDERCPREETYAALRRWCRFDNYVAAFDTNDTKINMGDLARDACEKYMLTALVVHRGYEQGRARLAAEVICFHRLEWRPER